MFCCMSWTQHSVVPLGNASSAWCVSEGCGSLLSHFVFVFLGNCLPLHGPDPPQSVCSFSKSMEIFLLLCVSVVFEILWRNPTLIKICSVFSFLISLVADPSFPLNLIVSCGKFLSFQGFLIYCLNFIFICTRSDSF